MFAGAKIMFCQCIRNEERRKTTIASAGGQLSFKIEEKPMVVVGVVRSVVRVPIRVVIAAAVSLAERKPYGALDEISGVT
jgi:hypothetical protein